MSRKLDKRTLRPWLPPRPKGAHKGDAGHVLVIAGSRGMMGAARLCALGALRAGAGLTTRAVPAGEGGGTRPLESMTLPLPSKEGAFHPRAVRTVLEFVRSRGVSAAALGPGLSMNPGAARFALRILEELAVPLVADADALNALAASGRRPRRSAPWVLTPHPGEAARLLKTSVARVQTGRREAAMELARRFGAVAVLKGARTLVAGGGACFENGTGNPGMASGGMGDVLTGMIAALIGQVRASSREEACLRAAALGVFLHGLAGDRAARELGPRGILAGDVAIRVPGSFKELSL